MKLGSNRKGYIPSKYDKSPFIANNLNGGGGGSGNIPIKQHADFLGHNGLTIDGKGGRPSAGGQSA
jgi:hypothetical protein